MTKTKTIYTVIVIEKQTRAYFKEVNLKNLIPEIIIETATTSFRIQFWFENHHPKQTPTLTSKLKISITLIETVFIFISEFLRKEKQDNKNKNQFVQSHTPASPKIQERTYTDIATKVKSKTPTTPPTIRRRLKAITRGRLILIPAPLIDHALEQTATIVIRIVEKIIQITMPYQKKVPQYSELHRMLQVKQSKVELLFETDIDTRLKQLNVFRLDTSQLFSMETLHIGQEPEQITQLELFNFGWKFQYLLIIERFKLEVFVTSLFQIRTKYGELALQAFSDCEYVYSVLTEQSNQYEDQVNKELKGGVRDELQTCTGVVLVLRLLGYNVIMKVDVTNQVKKRKSIIMS